MVLLWYVIMVGLKAVLLLQITTYSQLPFHWILHLTYYIININIPLQHYLQDKFWCLASFLCLQRLYTTYSTLYKQRPNLIYAHTRPRPHPDHAPISTTPIFRSRPSLYTNGCPGLRLHEFKIRLSLNIDGNWRTVI